MTCSIHQLAAFRLRSFLYKNFKRRFEHSADYQQWRLHRWEPLEAQLKAYWKWQQFHSGEIIEKLSRGLITPSRREIATLSLQAFLFRHLKGPLKRTRGYQRWRDFRNEPISIQMAARYRWRLIDSALLAAKVLKATAEEAKKIHLPIHEQPVVSILIPVYNKIEYTLTCLSSIQMNLPRTPFEVIVIDDCSTDATPQLLSQVRGIRVIRNSSNLGFLINCNNAAREARGQYLLFLNNDTEVQPEWLDELLQTFHTYPNAGLVGSKLIFPYGLLQEAGGIIWRDASGCNYGRDAYPERPEFCFLRDPDYCSGASIMVPADLFSSLEGFDERFTPAYYEDTDLAFTIRSRGRRVIFQPASKVIHHEGITSGTDVTKGVKAYQLHNQAKFLDKWREALKQHDLPNQKAPFAHERLVAKRALIVDVTTPCPDQDSGSVDTFYEIKVMQALGYKVTFIPDDLKHAGPYTEALQRIGVECWYEPYINTVREHLEASGPSYDLTIIKRVHFAAKHIEDIRRYCTKARIVFNTVDLHFLREERQAALEKSATLAAKALQTRELEYWLMKQADATITISDAERELILNEHPDLTIAAIPYIRTTVERRPSFASRRDIVFIGGFRHTPNVDAVLHFVQEIWSRVRQALPDVNLRIVGSNAPPEIAELAKFPGIVFQGYVADLDTVFHRCKLSVAPLRFGAGIKGKIGTSLSYGVPCVATPIAAEGMQLTDQQNILIASVPEVFARSIVTAYNDEALWKRLSENGIAYMREHYSFEQGVERYRALISSIAPVSGCPPLT